MKSLLIVFLIFFSSGVNSQGYLGKRLFVEYHTGLTPTLHKKMTGGKLQSKIFFIDHTASLSFVKSSLFSFGISTTFSRPFAATGGFMDANGKVVFEDDETLLGLRNMVFFEWSRKGNHAPTAFYVRIAFGIQSFSLQKESLFYEKNGKNTGLDFVSELKLGKRWAIAGSLLLDVGFSLGGGFPLTFYGPNEGYYRRFSSGFFSRAVISQHYYDNFQEIHNNNNLSQESMFDVFKRDIMRMTRFQHYARNLFKIRIGITLGVL